MKEMLKRMIAQRLGLITEGQAKAWLYEAAKEIRHQANISLRAQELAYRDLAAEYHSLRANMSRDF